MQPSPYLTFAIELAHAAGDIMKQHFTQDLTAETKSDNSPVTVADIAINQMVIDRITSTYPGHGILGEELSQTASGSSYTWVCDPIDGTLPYVMHLPISMFSLALVEDGRPILGLLYNPFTDSLYTAETGTGTFLNGQPIAVSKRATIAKATIDNEATAFVSLNPSLHAEKAKVTRFYCASCAGALVASGHFDALLFGSTSAWDIAAIKVLVEEAGGTVTDRDGNEQRYDQPINGAIVSNGHLHAELVKRISSI